MEHKPMYTTVALVAFCLLTSVLSWDPPKCIKTRYGKCIDFSLRFGGPRQCLAACTFIGGYCRCWSGSGLAKKSTSDLIERLLTLLENENK